MANTTIPVPLTNLVVNPLNNRFEPTAAGQSLISYDNAGNLTREVAGNTYGYNGENRMTVYNGGNPATGGASYAYDGDGRRVKKITSESTTIFVYDAAGQLVAEYTNVVPAPSTWAGISYLTADPLGTPRVITRADGTVKSRHDYLPFGEEVFAGTGGRTVQQGYTGDNMRQKFTGQQRDNETGLDYFGARYYASAQGRFTSPDPLLGSGSVFAPQSWNRYVYAFNNPLKYVDPTGMDPDDPYRWITDGQGNYMPLDEQQWQDYLNDREGDLYGGYYPVATGTNIGPLRFVTGSDEFVDANSGLIGSTVTLGADGNFQAVTNDTPSMQAGPGDTTGALQLLFEYLTGRGPADREFGPSDYMTQGMMTSPDVAAARQKFIEQGGGTYTGGVRFGLSAEDGPFEAGLNMPRQFVGSFTITITEHKDGDAHFVLENATTLRSALYQCPGVQPVERTTMLPLSNKTQTFWWIERGVIKR